MQKAQMVMSASQATSAAAEALRAVMREHQWMIQNLQRSLEKVEESAGKPHTSESCGESADLLQDAIHMASTNCRPRLDLLAMQGATLRALSFLMAEAEE